MLRDVLVHYDSGDDERTHKHWSSSSSLPVPPVVDRVHVVASPRSVKAREKKNLTTNRTGKGRRGGGGKRFDLGDGWCARVRLPRARFRPAFSVVTFR